LAALSIFTIGISATRTIHIFSFLLKAKK
jgi:hypothetical protein